MEINKEKLDFSGRTLSSENQVKINPVTDIDVEKANCIFDKFQKTRTEFAASKEVCIHYDEIFKCKESDFEFDDVNVPSEKLNEISKSLTDEQWKKLTVEEKKLVIEKAVYFVCQSLGIKDIPKVMYYNANPNDCGGYNFRENIMSFNEVNFDKPRLTLDVISHESWHAYQKVHAFDPKTQKDYLYLLNFKYYISPEKVDGKWVNFDSYEKQLLEAEARAFSKEIFRRVGF